MIRLTDLIPESANNTASNYKLFCDMDGVLVDFEKMWNEEFKETTKQTYARVGKDGFADMLNNVSYDFWVDMDWMPANEGGKALWDRISKYNPTILSAPSQNPISKKAKIDWLKNHGIDAPTILKRAERKQEEAAPNHILIDDFIRNIEQWRAKGGIGIHHTNNANTFRELAKYGIV